MSIYDTLNEQQREAVYCTDGPLLILAGAGSGKTRVLTHRIAYLIEEKGVNPWNILAITFTNKAAGEMRERVDNLVGFGSESIWVSTFHSTCVRILRRHIDRLGYDTNFTIYDTDDQKTLMKDVCKLVEIDTKVYKERNLLAAISSAKNEMISAQEYALNAQGDFGKEKIAKVYQEYEKQMHANNALDFDDLLVKTVQLFETQPDVLENYQERFRYIMVDEYQDTNTVQFQLVRLLAGKYRNLCVVGDDDQSIYGFRGADSRLMFQFQKDFPDAKQLLLDVNYRSSKNIVKNSLKVIANNEVRFDKKIRAWKESGETLHVQEVKDPVEEASYVVEQIKKQMETGILAEEIAVLFRVHTDARAVVEALIDEKIPFQMREHLPNLYNHFIAKDIMAYFRLAMGQRERKDFLQVMNRPKRYLGRDCLPGRVVSFEEMRKFYCDKEWMQDRIDQFEWDLKMLAKMAPYAAIQYLKKKIGYDEFLREYATTKNMKAADLREVLSEIEEAAKPFQTMEEWVVHVEEYTEALKKKEQQKEQNQEGVRLMTLHASKGLEFHTVFLIEANEGRIPYQKAEKEQNVEEERRLFYVGMTRAKDVLKITYVKIKNGKEISPSRFVEELFEGV